MPRQQPASLLSLPDELLARIIFNCGEDVDLRMDDIHPLWPLTHVCRRIRKLAQAVLYRHACLGPGSKATPHLRAIVGQNPSPGQLTHTLTISGTSTKRGAHDFELVQAVASRVSNLKQLMVFFITTEGASSILGELPSASLEHLQMHFSRTPVSFQWSDLWGQIIRFPKLRLLACQDGSPEAELVPRVPVQSGQHIYLPQLVKLHITDYILIEIFGAAGPLRRILPNLRELKIRISHSQDASAITALVSEAPAGLEALKLLPGVFIPATPRQYLPALPALPHLTHLELGIGTFIESELLRYLAVSPLKSIKFDFCAPVTDRILQALTGPGRPPQLREICLDHIEVAGPNEVTNELEDVYSEAGMSGDLDKIQRRLCPEWPDGGTEQGLRLWKDRVDPTLQAQTKDVGTGIAAWSCC